MRDVKSTTRRRRRSRRTRSMRRQMTSSFRRHLRLQCDCRRLTATPLRRQETALKLTATGRNRFKQRLSR